jgi:hypothetical protein
MSKDRAKKNKTQKQYSGIKAHQREKKALIPPLMAVPRSHSDTRKEFQGAPTLLLSSILLRNGDRTRSTNDNGRATKRISPGVGSTGAEAALGVAADFTIPL